MSTPCSASRICASPARHDAEARRLAPHRGSKSSRASHWDLPAGATIGIVGGIGLGQVDARASARAPLRADGGSDPLRRARHRPSHRRRHAAAAPRAAGHLPGPLFFAQSQKVNRRHYRGPTSVSSRRHRRRRELRPSGSGAGCSWPARRVRRALPARIIGRAASARRHRARDRAVAAFSYTPTKSSPASTCRARRKFLIFSRG